MVIARPPLRYRARKYIDAARFLHGRRTRSSDICERREFPKARRCKDLMGSLDDLRLYLLLFLPELNEQESQESKRGYRVQTISPGEEISETIIL